MTIEIDQFYIFKPTGELVRVARVRGGELELWTEHAPCPFYATADKLKVAP